MWLKNCHCCRCSSWRLWYLSFRFDDGSGWMTYIIWALGSIARLFFLQSWTDSLILLQNTALLSRISQKFIIRIMIKVNSMIRTKCQNMLRWSGQNANQKFGRTKCQPKKKSGQNANFSVGILYGWHFVRTPDRGLFNL